jgi:hypothetical protein
MFQFCTGGWQVVDFVFVLREDSVRATISALCFTFILAAGLSAQQANRTEPVSALRDNGTGYHALVGARVVTAPGQVIEGATIVIRNGLIQSVGRNQDPPAGARVWDLTGHTVYS